MKLWKQCSDLVVVRVDGGICSQIMFVALGLCLQGKGCRVKYDLSWYRSCGTDLTGRFVRKWDMPMAFPQLHLEEASENEIASLRAHRAAVGGNVASFAAPLYIGGYPDRGTALFRQREFLRNLFVPQIDSAFADLIARMSRCLSCAVHVRRGDLSGGDACYGGATTVDYYRRSMLIVSGLFKDAKFFFFSDEPRWVKENLVCEVPLGHESEIVDSNGSDKGYWDLYAMSRCDCVISSIGSLGVIGAILSQCNKCLVMSHRRDWVSSNMANVIYLNDDLGRAAQVCDDGMLARIPERKLHGAFGLAFRAWRKMGSQFFKA